MILFIFVFISLDKTNLAPVPQFSSLPPIAKAPMVKPILPQEINSPAQPLFRTLIPYTVRQSIALYNERKTTLINKQLIPEWEAITSQEHALLRELGLPGSLQAVEVSLGLPPSLVTHMDDVKAKGGIAKLKQMRADVRNLCASDKEIYEQVVTDWWGADVRLRIHYKRKQKKTKSYEQNMELRDGLVSHRVRRPNLFVSKEIDWVHFSRRRKIVMAWFDLSFLNGRI
jgi:hypothetical protein